MDLSDLGSVEKLADEAIKKLPRLDFLICNAGVMAPPKTYTRHGFELQMGTNHVGHQALCQKLAPFMAMRKEGECKGVIIPKKGRIVILSSMSHKWGKLNIDDLHYKKSRYNPW